MFKHLSSIEDFRSLIDYYISCLEKEDLLSLSFNYRLEGNKFYSRIIKKEQLFLQGKEQIEIEKTPEIQEVFNKEQQKKRSLFYGYPLFMDPNGNISPVFFIELLFEEKDGKIIFTKESVAPEFNHYILAKNNYNVEEIKNYRQEIEEGDNFKIKFERVAELLNLNKGIISEELEQNPFIVRSSSQLVNKAILYFGERTGLTKGLLDELHKLNKLSSRDLKATSLDILFKNGINDKKKQLADISEPESFLEISPLNNSQQKATEESFIGDVNVVTGPPGTGKSQVVVNIIANAVWNNKTVLFASKNNRAVDVVIEKLGFILSKDLIVRMGSSKHRKEARIKIQSLLEGKKDLKIQRNIKKEELTQLSKKVSELSHNISYLSKLNQEIEKLQGEADEIAKNIPPALYDECKREEFALADKFELEMEIKNNFGIDSSLIIVLRKLFPSYFRRKELRTFKKYYHSAPANFKRYVDKNIKLTRKSLKETLQLILLFAKIEGYSKEIKEVKEEVSGLPSLYSLENKKEKLSQKRIKLSQRLLENHWFDKIKSISLNDENSLSRYFDAAEKLERYVDDYSLWRQLTSNRISEFRKILSFLPIWVVTNLSAKNSLPFKENFFDLVVIDEASQCDIASALPLLYRAKQAVIIGDPKQLKHISLLNETQDKKIASQKNTPELYLDYAYSKNSLYDIAERVIKNDNKPPIFLNQHYRSHQDIINFSNECFYEKKLNIMTDESKLIPEKVYPWGIKWQDVRGKTSQTKSPYNKEEATEIIKILKSFKKSSLKGVSFGVVTLFRAQMELIDDKISKTKMLENMDITVGTTHRFQGDEKDIIIFSPAVSQGAKKTTLNWIRTTTQLLNVAVTRARSVLIIVGDKKKCSETEGFLSNLACYPESKKSEINFDSPAEEKLFKALRKEKIKILPQYGVKVKGRKPYYLDFALFINGNKYNIEVDGGKSHSQKADSDVLRDIHLRMEGWKVRRFPANEVFDNMNRVVEEIKRFC